jgi:DnaJ-class molecular chaperone
MQVHCGSEPRQGNKRSADPRLVGDLLTMAARRLAFPQRTMSGDRVKCQLAQRRPRTTASRPLRGQPKEQQTSPRIICSVCDGTGMRAYESGPRGATWTDYERCPTCKGVGSFTVN